MPLDPQIEESINAAVNQAGQPPALARKIVAWMNSIVSGNETLNDKSSSRRHLELLYNETIVDITAEDNF